MTDESMNVIKTIHHDRAYKDCLCCVCGEISKCTPSNDFYSTPDHGEGLVCERCFHKYCGHKINAKRKRLDLVNQTPGLRVVSKPAVNDNAKKILRHFFLKC
jgi:hypothetical protein